MQIKRRAFCYSYRSRQTYWMVFAAGSLLARSQTEYSRARSDLAEFESLKPTRAQSVWQPRAWWMAGVARERPSFIEQKRSLQSYAPATNRLGVCVNEVREV